jgi:hypothetical protein
MMTRPNLLFFLIICAIGLLRVFGYLSLLQSLLLIILAAVLRFIAEGLSSPLSWSAFTAAKAQRGVSSVLTVLRLEKAVHLALVGAKFADGPRAQVDPKIFHYKRASSYELTFYSLCFTLLVEIPFVHLIVHYKVVADYRLGAHLILLFFSIYGLIWLISDKRAVGTTYINVGAAALEFRVGWRQWGWIPREDIIDAKVLKQSIRSFRKTVNCSRRDVTIVTPMDDPNVILELSSTNCSGVEIDLFGSRRPSGKYIAIFVDDPLAFVRHCGPREQFAG